MEFFLGNNQKQVCTYSNPYLRVHGVLCRPIERLHVKPPFNPFEETFDRPSLTVEFRNGERRQCKIIGDKGVDVVRCIILIDDQPYAFWIEPRSLDSSKANVLVADYTSTYIDRTFIYDLVFHIGLCSGNKERMLLLKDVIETLEIYISLIYEVVSTSLNRHIVKDLGIVYAPIGKMYEGWNVTSQIEQCVHLNSSPVMMKPGPWAKFETQFYRAAVKSIGHLVKPQPEVVPGIKLLCFPNQILSKIMIDTPVLFLIHLTECRARDETQTGMVKLLLKSRQGGLIGTKALLRGELCERHNHELVAA